MARKIRKPAKVSTYLLTPLTKRDLDFVRLVLEGSNRYAINGIYWDAPRGHLVVTNNVYILVLKLTDKFKNGPTVILDGDAMIKMHKRLKKSETVDSICMSDGTATLKTSESVSYDIPLVEGNYPKYDEVMRDTDKDPIKATGLNPVLVSKVLAALPEPTEDDSVPSTKLNHHGHTFRMTCKEKSGREWVAILMGMSLR